MPYIERHILFLKDGKGKTFCIISWLYRPFADLCSMQNVSIQLRLMRIYFNSIGRAFPNKSANQLIKLFSTPRSRVIRSKEIEVLKTAKTTWQIFQKEKIRIYEWGNGDKLALLCHGWESNAGSLGAFVAPLLKRGYRVVSYDGPAHGESQGKEASLITFTQVAKMVVKKFGKIDLAIGHSLGANVIMLMNYETQISIPKCILISPVNRIVSVFEGFKNIFKIPNSIYNRMVNLISKRTNYQLDSLLFEDIVLKSPYQEVLLMHDVADKITPVKHSEEIAKNWTEVSFKPIKGSGHYKILWHEDTLTNSFQFIDA